MGEWNRVIGLQISWSITRDGGSRQGPKRTDTATAPNKEQQREGGVDNSGPSYFLLSHVSHSLQPLPRNAQHSSLSPSPPAAAMMLVQKQPTLHISQPHSTAFSHRRHPSAPPTVIVQPTRTPGLLSLSKPTTKSSPQRQLPSNQRSPQNKQSPRPRQAQPVQHGLLNAAEITDKKNAVRPPKSAHKLPKGQRCVDKNAQKKKLNRRS